MTTETLHLFTGVPSCFRACCRDASRASIHGTAWSYKEAGRLFGELIGGLVPYSFEPEDEWLESLEQSFDLELAKGLAVGFDWITEHYPRCAELIPKRRQQRFMIGFVQTYRDGHFDEGLGDE